MFQPVTRNQVNGYPGPSGEIGVVIIGRNEGDRLKRCVASVKNETGSIVYVDSGSTDGSAQWASEQGVTVVNLDMTRPFTAARARNEGFSRLQQLTVGLKYVQFVDGDCEVVDGWLVLATTFLDSNPHVAAVCGRRREVSPKNSIYNRLCDMEWDTPVGKTRSCGGDVMMRADALNTVGGYRENMIAGEEPELCVRLRKAGWLIWRLPAEMTTHDAAIRRFGQWWKRTTRSGHAFAEGAFLHGTKPEQHGVRETIRAMVWGLMLPCATLVLALIHPAWLLMLLAYPLQVMRLSLRGKFSDRRQRDRALFLVLARFPEAQGCLQFWFNRFRRKPTSLIEYK